MCTYTLLAGYLCTYYTLLAMVNVNLELATILKTAMQRALYTILVCVFLCVRFLFVAFSFSSRSCLHFMAWSMSRVFVLGAMPFYCMLYNTQDIHNFLWNLEDGSFIALLSAFPSFYSWERLPCPCALSPCAGQCRSVATRQPLGLILAEAPSSYGASVDQTRPPSVRPPACLSGG